MEPILKQQLIAKFHLETIPTDEAESILNDAGIIVMTGVVTRSIPLLDEEGAAACDTLLASDADIAEIFKLLKERVPSFQAIVDEEIDLLEKTLA
jgi:hypothetical protein